MNKKNKKSFLTFSTIRSKLLIVLIFQTIMLVSFYFYIVHLNQENAKERLSFENQKIAEYISNKVENIILNIRNNTLFPINRSGKDWKQNEISNYLVQKSDNNSTDISPYLYFEEFNTNALNLIHTYDYIDFVAISDIEGNIVFRTRHNGSYFITKSDLYTEWAKKTWDQKGGFTIFPKGSVIINNTDVENMIVGTRSIVRVGKYDNIGMIIVGVYPKNILSLFYGRSIFSNQSLFILQEDGKDLLGTEIDVNMSQLNSKDNSQLLQSKEGEKYVVEVFPYESYGLKYVIKTPYIHINYFYQIKYYFWIIYVILALTMIITIQKVFSSITTPMKLLIYACKKVEEGCYDFEISINPHNEFDKLVKAFKSMAITVDNLVNQVLLKELMEKQLEMQMLRSQINPHFLYNTLDSMQMNAYINNDFDVAKMCHLLGDILRNIVSAQGEMTTVFEEITFINKYIELVKYRYPNINILTYIDDSIVEKQMLKFLLQPIIENAINHGIAENENAGTINIMGYLDNEHICFNISDNGIGMSKEKIALIKEEMNSLKINNKSIGLPNINRRIKLYYGDQYELSIESKFTKGTVVSFKLPLKPVK